MNKVQVEGLAAVLGVVFHPVRPHLVSKTCSNNHRDYHCRNRATEEAVKREGINTIAIPTCSNAYCRISAAVAAHVLSLPPAKARADADVLSQKVIQMRGHRSLKLVEENMYWRFGRHLSLVPR